MSECTPRGFKVSVKDVTKAANNAIAYGNEKKNEAMEIEIQNVMKRLFFRDRTYEEAKAKVLESTSIFDNDWLMAGSWSLDWGKTMLRVVSVVKDDFVWLTKDEADDVARYLNN